MLTTLLNYRVIDIACGSYHSLAIGVIRDKVKNELNSVDKKLDLLFVWGNNSRGQLGIEEEEKITIPTINDYCEFRDLCKISCGLEHSAILLKSGKAYLMGDNTKKQISISLLKNGITKVSKPLLISFKEGQNSDIHCTANSTYIILGIQILNYRKRFYSPTG